MARLPLTVYLPRAVLTRLEVRARVAGVARSAWALSAIQAALAEPAVGANDVISQLNELRLSMDELVAAQRASALSVSPIKIRQAQPLNHDHQEGTSV